MLTSINTGIVWPLFLWVLHDIISGTIHITSYRIYSCICSKKFNIFLFEQVQLYMLYKDHQNVYGDHISQIPKVYMYFQKHFGI